VEERSERKRVREGETDKREGDQTRGKEIQYCDRAEYRKRGK
jgi:hypothetical protein